MKTKSETAVTAKITVTIAGQSFEMTVTEAKNLKAQLEAAIPEKPVINWPSYPERVVERPVYIPVPRFDRQDRQDRLLYPREFPPYEITCGPKLRGAIEC